MQINWILLAFVLLVSGVHTTVLAGEFELRLDDVPVHVSFELANLKQGQEQKQNLTTRLKQELHQQLEQLTVHTTGSVKAEQDINVQRDLEQRCMQWERQTQRAFSCRLGELDAKWQQARANGELPDRAELRQLAGKLRKEKNGITAEGIHWHAWVLDVVVERLHLSEPQGIAQQLTFIRLRIGSLQRCWEKDATGTNTCASFDASVQKTFANLPMAQLVTANAALGIIDQQNADFMQKVGPYRLSKVINPRDGWLVEFAPSVMVTAGDSFTASAVAQALVVKPPAQAIAWANSLTGVAALVVDEQGRVFATRNWYQQLDEKRNLNLTHGFWKQETPFVIDYEIAKQNVAEYRKPYLALWISDSAGKPVKHLRLSGDNSRWLRELTLWWRRQGRLQDGLIDAIAGATEKPAVYRLEWDGRDDFGKPLVKGNYELHIEVAREHGAHELIDIPFVLEEKGFELQARGKAELGKIGFGFSPE